jgi:uncharacterized protein YegL
MAIAVDAKLSREERLPCVLIVDGSSSMSTGDAIGHLNRGLQTFQTELQADPMASLRVRILVIRVGDTAQVLTDWTDAVQFTAPTVVANGATPLGGGIELALSKIAQMRAELKAAGISRKKPWVFIMTDGAPTDADVWNAASAKLQNEEMQGNLFVFPIAVGDHADPQELKKCVSPERNVIRMDAAKFKEMFKYVSDKSKAASTKPQGAQQDMGGWGTVVT